MGLWDAVGAIGGAAIGLIGASKSAGAVSDASNSANRLTQKQWEQTREDYAPWLGAGRNALYATSALAGVASPDLTQEENQKVLEAAVHNFQTSPGYQFQLSEGINALDRSAASRGRLVSGAHDKAVSQT